MKRSIRLRIAAFVLILLLLPLPSIAETDDLAEPQIKAEHAVIFSASDGGEILYERQGTDPVYCGFLSRVMTCLMIAERIPDLNETVTVTQEMLFHVSAISSARLSAGDEISYADLIACINVVNSQEAAVAAAMSLSGTLDAFVKEMNDRAAALGATHTVFTNVTGSYTENTRQITTIEDCAILLSEALKYDVIAEGADQRVATVTVNGKEKKLYTKNLLIEKTSEYYDPNAKGLFIYSEEKSNSAIATCRKESGNKIVSLAITTQGLGSVYRDAATLLEYSKNTYTFRTILKEGVALKELKVRYGQGVDFVVLLTTGSVTAYLPKQYGEGDTELIFDVPETVDAPVEKGQVFGTVTVRCGGKEYGKVELKAQNAVAMDNFNLYSDKIKGFFTNIWLWLILGAILLLVGGYVLLTIRLNKTRRKRSSPKDTGGRIRMTGSGIDDEDDD